MCSGRTLHAFQNISVLTRVPIPDPFLRPSAIGMSVGAGIITYRLAQTPGGELARIEVGRSPFRNAGSPSYITCFGVSSSYVVIPEPPLKCEMMTILGVTAFGSDDDEESTESSKRDKIYSFTWHSKVRLKFLSN